MTYRFGHTMYILYIFFTCVSHILPYLLGTSVEEGDHHQDEAVENIIDMNGHQNVFSMKDKDGNSRRDHHEYRKLVLSGSIFAYNYWWPLGFPGIREPLHFFNSCHHLYL